MEFRTAAPPRRPSCPGWSATRSTVTTRGKSFRTRAEGNRYRSLLMQAVQAGGRVDETTGEPESWQTPSTARRRPEGLRVHLNTALAPGSERDAQHEKWMAKNSLTLGDIDRERIADIDRRLGLKTTKLPRVLLSRPKVQPTAREERTLKIARTQLATSKRERGARGPSGTVGNSARGACRSLWPPHHDNGSEALGTLHFSRSPTTATGRPVSVLDRCPDPALLGELRVSPAAAQVWGWEHFAAPVEGRRRARHTPLQGRKSPARRRCVRKRRRSRFRRAGLSTPASGAIHRFLRHHK